MLTDIEFLDDGRMLLGFGDRSAYQAGRNNFAVSTSDNDGFNYQASGDMYKICKVAGAFVDEGAAGCPSRVQEQEPRI